MFSCLVVLEKPARAATTQPIVVLAQEYAQRAVLLCPVALMYRNKQLQMSQHY